MFTGTFKFYRLLVRTIRGEDSPKQVAMGIALGMLVGVIPQDNLISLVLATLILATRVNLFAALISGFTFAWIGFALDPLLDRLGALILTAESLNGLWTWLYEMRVVPWTKFNNTVVMGSMTFGVAIFYPVYQISESLISKYGPPVHHRMMNYRVYRKLAGIKEVSTEVSEGNPS